MPKFKVIVTEDVTMKYDPIEIDAETEDEAREIAEDMRCNGGLGEAFFVEVDEVYYDVRERKDEPK